MKKIEEVDYSIESAKIDEKLTVWDHEGEKEEHGARVLAQTPLITDGTFLYVISREIVNEVVNEEEQRTPNLLVEWYDIENDFKFVD